MNETREVSAREAPENRTNGTDTALSPPVDIYEDANGITVLADMPGVSRERLTVQIDSDTLLIEGDSALDVPEGMEALYADIRSRRLRRTFTLSSELETDKVEASLRDGVLTVHIPKREEVRPRKIDVKAAL